MREQPIAPPSPVDESWVTYSDGTDHYGEWEKRTDGERAKRTLANLSRSAIATLEYWRSQAIPDPVWVYFAAMAGKDGKAQGLVKIGSATDPAKRVDELQCGNPWKLKVWEVVLASRDFEAYLHGHWRPLRVRGEWFYHGYPQFYMRRAHNAANAQMREHDDGCRQPRRLKWIVPASILTPGGDW